MNDKKIVKQAATMAMDINNAKAEERRRALQEEWAWHCCLSAKQKTESLIRMEEIKEREHQAKLERNRLIKEQVKQEMERQELIKLWHDSKDKEVDSKLVHEILAGVSVISEK